jgi:hypothetical protein
VELGHELCDARRDYLMVRRVAVEVPRGLPRDARKREALLHRIQQAMHERVMFTPIVEPAFLNGIGPRVDEAGLGLITGHLYSAPYEDLRIKSGRR